MARKNKKTHTFNSLRYAKRLKAAGFNQQQAEIQSETLSDLIDNQLVTKTDLKETESKLRSLVTNKIELLRRDMKLWFGSMLVAAVAFLSTLITTLSFIHH